MSLATRIAQEFNNVRSHISGITSTHLLGGNLSVSNEVITNGFSTTLYTGNGGAQSVNTGINMATQWGNDVSETFGGLVWLKSRSAATNNYFVNTVRGATKDIYSNATTAETTEATGLTSFNSTGFNLGTLAGMNTNLATYASWNFQTTHRRTGVTNHGKTINNHFNPFSGFGIAVFAGSGLAGHEISTLLGRKVALYHIKNISSATDWFSQHQYDLTTFLKLNLTDAKAAGVIADFTDNSIVLNAGTLPINQAGQTYVCYYWANSYYDEAGKLIGNYEVGIYQGTGVAGNKVITRGKPVWIMIKRLDSTSQWEIVDNQRVVSGNDGLLYANLSVEETTEITRNIEFLTDGFTLNTSIDLNASGGQYLYMVVYDNDSGSGKSKYPKATDTSNVQINNALIPLAHGVDSNGSKNSIVVANETIIGLTYTAGKNYLYKTDTGYGVKPYEPRYLSSELVRRFAGESPDYYDVQSNKWFNTDAGTDLVSNGKFDSGVTTGWTAVASTLSIVNNTIRVTSNSASYGQANFEIATVIGKKYKATFKINAKSNTQAGVYIDSLSGIIGVSGSTIVSTGISASVGSYTLEFVAQTTTTYIKLAAENVSGYWAQFDDISVFPVDITPTTEITESRNYLNHIVHADQNGQVTYVEELPKIEYKDVIKANELKGKNACTAWALVDMSTTPPTILDSYNIKAIIRVATGVGDAYFNEDMDNINYSMSGSGNIALASEGVVVNTTSKSLNKLGFLCGVPGTAGSTALTGRNAIVEFHIFGGKTR